MPVIVLAYCLAALFEAVGLTLAFIGFNRTWKVFVDTETLPTAVGRSSRSAVRSSAVAAGRWGRNLLHLKSRPKHVVATGATVSARATVSATGRVSFGPLPSIDDDPQGCADAVHDRFQRVHSTAQDAQDAIADERKARAETVAKLDDRLAARIHEVEGKSKSVAVGGLVEQVWGWLFILTGLVLGTIANIMSALR